MAALQQRFEVDRPVSAVYNAFLRPDQILQNVPGVTGVSRLGEDVFRLLMGSADAPQQVDLMIVSRTPSQRIEWRVNDRGWFGSIELQPLGAERTAVTMNVDAADTAGAEQPSATALHDGLQALKRALQSSQVRVTTGRSRFESHPGSSAGKRYASEWRDTARTAFTRPAEFPFTLMRTISRQVDRAWNDVMRVTPIARLPHLPGLPWNPNVEVCEQNDQVRICIDVPGVDESNLQVDIDEGSLTIRGDRQDERINDPGQRRSELHYGAFTRRIPLPDGIDADGAKALLRNGVLEIRIPMHRRAPRRVPVQQVPQ